MQEQHAFDACSDCIQVQSNSQANLPRQHPVFAFASHPDSFARHPAVSVGHHAAAVAPRLLLEAIVCSAENSQMAHIQMNQVNSLRRDNDTTLCSAEDSKIEHIEASKVRSEQ